MRPIPLAWALLLLPTLLAHGQEPQAEVLRNPAAPAWVEHHDIPVDAATPEDSSHNDVYFLLADRQVHVPSRSRYFHYAYRFLSQTGIQEESQIETSFAPSYETLVFHALRIHRNGEVIDKLPEQDFRLLQRETGHERQLYDGRFSAMALVEDVRVGDILEFAYTIQGANPVFGDHFTHLEAIRWGSPLEKAVFRILWEPERPLALRQHGIDLDLPVRSTGDLREISLVEHQLQPVLSDGDLPVSYFPRPWLSFTDYPDWQSVAEWARRQYPIETGLPEELAEVARELERLERPEDRIAGALRWVQDEIRYLGLFEGMHSYRPYPLETILQRRFGDCKDKSLTLITLLRSMGFEAYPALVDTDYCETLSGFLPSPQHFDHLVVQVRHAGRIHWLDATDSFQRGPLEELYFPAYGYALVVEEGTTGLTPVEPNGFEFMTTEVTETFDIKDYRGNARFTVETVYRGRQAEYIRADFASTSRDQTEKQYLNFYSQDFPGIRLAAPMQIRDDQEANVLTTVEAYDIDGLWTPMANDPDRMIMEFYANIVSSELVEPSTRIRSMPFGLPHPRHVVERMIVNFPTPLELAPDFTEIDNPAFHFTLEEKVTPRRLELTYEYRSKKHAIPPEEIPRYLKDIADCNDVTGYSVWVPSAYAEQDPKEILRHQAEAIATETFSMPATPLILAHAAGFLSAALIGLGLFFWDPHPAPARPPYNPQATGLGGWMIVVAIGVFLRPLISILSIPSTLFEIDQSLWVALGNPENEAFDPLWHPALLFGGVATPAFLAFEILIIVLFVRKRTSFPYLLALYFGLSILSTSLTACFSTLIDGFDQPARAERYANAFRTIVAGAIWAPYCLISRRSRQTFTQRRRETNPPPLPPPLPLIP